MLKRSGAILLTMLYTVTVLGFALNLHYCGTHVASVKINSPAIGCDMPKTSKMKCCKDSQLQVKVKDAHQAEPASVLAKLFGFELSRLPFSNIFFTAPHNTIEKLFDRAPPDVPRQSIASFIKNCIFRI
ncbi:hypothetical protein SAMN05216464_109186 [Mucilaginibacter pineti]|uniref:Uncharacterized protein n=1 Tax=Mucilaginibacter pineti TaxID=1391627 RepID=A0A1G7FSB9_9SPHI|nr:hypothetical protein [Mucilaginibacter pineti]SDE78615.1 hypothetical protein SAMN05216464_109186 [Mucilaginibacter pineti]